MKLKEYLGVGTVEGDVGLEIEVEGNVGPISAGRWHSVADGSLRGGVEYITRGALPVGEVKNRVEFLRKKLNGQEVFSFRCSLHVHVNMLEKTTQQILNTIYLMYLMEPVFFKNSGEQRNANRFCLGISHAESQLATFEEVLRSQNENTVLERFRFYNENSHKYSATNLCSLRRLGTIEIRTMEGTVDPQRVADWCKFLVNIREFASSKNNFREIAEAVFETSPEHFINTVLDSPSMIYRSVSSQVQLQRSLLVNIEYSFPNEAFPNVENPSVQNGVQEREVAVPTFRGATNPPHVTITDGIEAMYRQLREQRDSGQFQWRVDQFPT